MNKWKLTFIFLTGFMLREVMGHIWLSADGVLPFTSRMFGITITPDVNFVLVIVNTIILLVCAHLAFIHRWEGYVPTERHA